MKEALRYTGELVEASTVFNTNEKFLCPCCGMPVQLVVGTDLVSAYFKHLAGSRSIVGDSCELFSKESTSKRNARVFSEKAVHKNSDALRAAFEKLSKEEVIDAAVAMHRISATEIARIHREKETMREDLTREFDRANEYIRYGIDEKRRALERDIEKETGILLDREIKVKRREMAVEYREKLVDFLKVPQDRKEVVKKYLYGVSTQMINYPDAEKAIDRIFK